MRYYVDVCTPSYIYPSQPDSGPTHMYIAIDKFLANCMLYLYLRRARVYSRDDYGSGMRHYRDGF